MSETTSCRPWTEPGVMSESPVPIAIEQADPDCTKVQAKNGAFARCAQPFTVPPPSEHDTEGKHATRAGVCGQLMAASGATPMRLYPDSPYEIRW
jgi:hypothetical protein